MARHRSDDFERELQFHIDQRIDHYLALGMTADEARRRARLDCGGITQTKEAMRDQRSWRPLDTFVSDVRFAIRSLRRTPVFAVTAAAVLALGIGANATVFTIVNAVLLRPLPFDRADDLVQVRRRTPSGSSVSFSIPDYLALVPQRGALSSLAILDVMCAGRYNIMTAGVAEPIAGCRASAQFFAALGVSAVHGRLFAVGDDEPGRAPIAVISEALWRGRFGGDPRIAGRALIVGGQSLTVVGVAPATVRAFSPAEIFVILPVPEASSDRTNSFQVLGRVESGLAPMQAQAQLDALARRHAQGNPTVTNMPQGIVLRSVQESFLAPIRPALQALMVAVGLVLVIACSNVANLVLARTLSRRRELAVMAALGASRWRIVQRVLTENLIVAAAGGAVGLLMTSIAIRALPAVSAVGLPQTERIHVDATVLLFTLVIATLAGLVAGLPPALQLGSGDLVRWMKEGSPQGGATPASQRVRAALALAQVALSTILLVGAALLARTFWNLASVDPGFRAERLLTMTVSLAPARYPDANRLGAYTDAVADRLERIPGVVAASSTTALPSELVIDFPVSIVGGAKPRASAPGQPDLDAWYRAINPHFFTAMGIPILAGRTFDAGDSTTAAPVIIVTQSFARAAFPNGDALGRAVVIGTGYLKDVRDLRPRTIVGIAGDTREQGLRFAPTLTMYVPVPQSPELIARLTIEKIPLRWVVRTTGEPVDVIAAARQAVLAVDAAQPPTDFASMSEVLGRSIASSRFNMIMLTVFGGLALALAATGVYGLTAYAVAQRTRELGIRLSLGASPARLVAAQLAEGLRLCLAGTAIGVAGALALGRLLSGLLFGISATDGFTLGAVVVGMIAVVGVATYVPASRAAKLDPTLALRND